MKNVNDILPFYYHRNPSVASLVSDQNHPHRMYLDRYIDYPVLPV
jgi:hypothetical protein